MEKICNKVIQIILVVMFSSITLLAVLQIVSRFLGIPLSWPDEALRFLFIWFVMVGSAYALRMKRHIVVDFISGFTSEKVSMYIELFVNLLIMVLLYVFIRHGFEVANTLGIQTSPILKIPMTYVFLAVPVGGILMLIYTILNIFDLVKERGAST